MRAAKQLKLFTVVQLRRIVQDKNLGIDTTSMKRMRKGDLVTAVSKALQKQCTETGCQCVSSEESQESQE